MLAPGFFRRTLGPRKRRFLPDTTEESLTRMLIHNREADQRLFFATRIVHFLFFLNPKFQASSLLL